MPLLRMDGKRFFLSKFRTWKLLRNFVTLGNRTDFSNDLSLAWLRLVVYIFQSVVLSAV
uniref:Uncharacterized protein n=1 Tax=Anguilla anguilla TaxID=7936 RepID=A0A0E9R101_ANGAN